MHNTLFLWKNTIGDIMLYYLNCFYLYSFFGFLVEFFVKIFFFKGMNSGILQGPWLPVYGFGVVIIIFMMRLLFHHTKFPRWIKVILFFVFVSFFLSLIEYLGGILIEKLFHQMFWDYRNMRFSFGPYVSLEMTLVWGFSSLFIIYVVKRFLDPIIKKIPIWLTILISVFFLIDVFYTFLF